MRVFAAVTGGVGATMRMSTGYQTYRRANRTMAPGLLGQWEYATAVNVTNVLVPEAELIVIDVW